jgi:hypothetical protein
LTNEVSVSRKIKEALLAYRIESQLSKDRILEIYLNEIYLGAGAYGVAAAADTYFGKPLGPADPRPMRRFSRRCPRRPTITTRSTTRCGQGAAQLGARRHGRRGLDHRTPEAQIGERPSRSMRRPHRGAGADPGRLFRPRKSGAS